MEEITESVDEKRLLRKVDIRIIPVFTLLYVLAFLDRVALLMIGWSIVMIIMAFVKNYPQLLVTRLLLGIFEAGLFPAIIYHITKWYKRSEQSYRVSLFFTGSLIAGAFSGLLAFAIMRLDGKFGLNSWQWIFLIDGLVTVVVAFASYFLISDYPETTAWLTEDERKIIVDRLQFDSGQVSTTHFDKHQICEAFKDWKIYIASFIQFIESILGYSLSFFLPSIVNGLGFGKIHWGLRCWNGNIYMFAFINHVQLFNMVY
ncbi:major facilitator superfamily domain-containing protein [Gigaspora rosea]|uniref:Major facilitator superfamily domain-containing protein n=1 Tax=Gigaspora rosea TaxID=44941 RepID=A0A397W754_9GLOM|nr:major facilitator superfamily domain-containing protein [Gigaspora rosea]